MKNELLTTLISIEESFWKGDAAFYAAHLAEDAEMVLPEPAGVLTREQTIEAIANSPRWTRVSFDAAHVVRLSDDAATLIYRCVAARDDGSAPYTTLASSTYVRRSGAWRLAVHQQTPLASA